MGPSGDKISPELKDLVADTREKSENKVNDVLSKLKDLVGRKSLGDQRDLEACKQSLYSHGVLQYCSSSLKFSPAKIHGGYAVLTQMADLLSTCCVGLGAFRDMEVFSHDFLPSVVESLLFLAERLMNRALRDKEHNEIIRLFRKVFDSIGWLLRAHTHLIHHVLGSKHYENIQICEDDDVSTVTVTMWNNIFRANGAVVAEMGNRALTDIMDDIVYKMSSSSNPVIGRAAVKTLVLIMDHSSSTHQLIHRRYRGLADLAVKDWRGKGFDSVLDQLIDHLRSDVPWRDTKESSEEYVRAACIIQAAWRAHQTRKRLRKLPRAVSTLQRSFREKRRRQLEHTERQRAEEELRHQVCLRRQRAMRQFRQHQLHLMEILPAAQVERYLGELENKAAVLIQRVWRGHRERRNFQQHRYILRQHRAAVTLQRAILQFLKRRRAQRSILTPLKGPKGLTDSRRTELRQHIQEHVSLHPSSVTSAEGSVELHQRAQSLLHQHLINRASDRAQEQHRCAVTEGCQSGGCESVSEPLLPCGHTRPSIPQYLDAEHASPVVEDAWRGVLQPRGASQERL
ncbi:IQ calmodulin-binding motif-containing protein 1 isoform X2 [Sinocyclocheilus anshuiensis]|uniref:IQ calmodulin-binding motif-containing protein 1 isoform X2 n=1 Tax=Sinocyclocheilus anshuiensis TaxID=1608454 RepID=UPI0007B82505|nr:PREDICTED: IQ calmodulin-binding motif-containing protein 1-like isoform X2 [Sinocyclocheilus anshuiensis]